MRLGRGRATAVVCGNRRVGALCFALVALECGFLALVQRARLHDAPTGHVLLAPVGHTPHRQGLDASAHTTKANVVASRATPGLVTDMQVLARALQVPVWMPDEQRLPHSSDFQAASKCDDAAPSDALVNLHVQDFNTCVSRRTPAASNWLSVNLEWAPSLEDLRQVSVVLCKSLHAASEMERLAAAHALQYRVVLTRHTSTDPRVLTVLRDYNAFLHLPGKTFQKQTDVVLRAWIEHPEFPTLRVYARGAVLKRLKRLGFDLTALPPNVDLRQGLADSEEIRHALNAFGVHVCPSVTEGFGHYINEARAVGAVVITTDAPPMNELVGERSGVLVRPTSVRLATKEWSPVQFVEAVVSVDAVVGAVQRVLGMPLREKEELGRNARLAFESDTEFFQAQMRQLGALIQAGHVGGPRDSDGLWRALSRGRQTR